VSLRSVSDQFNKFIKKPGSWIQVPYDYEMRKDSRGKKIRNIRSQKILQGKLRKFYTHGGAFSSP
jgi:hypothetical protein